MFERLRDAINAALDAATGPPDGREAVSGMRDAIIEAKAGMQGMREGMAQTEQKLAKERANLEDAERRGKMAAEIEDQETADIAREFVEKHSDRVAVLEKKLEAQRAEIALVERELEGMKVQLKKAVGSSSSVDTAWREIESAGGTRPETDVNDDLLKNQFDRAAREANADAQLEALKKKMGR